jgi:phage terminase small subunit
MSPEAKAAENTLLEMPLARPEPPPALTPAQAKVWRKVVQAMPANWFRPEMLELLEAYSVLVDRWRGVRADVNAMQASGVIGEKFYKAVRQETNMGRSVMVMATKLRLTPRTVYDKTKKKPVALRKPWEPVE